MKHKKHSAKSKKEKRHKTKKKSKETKKHARRRQNSSSGSASSSTDGEENVWVEKEAPPGVRETRKEEPLKREEWMGLNSLIPCVSNMPKEDEKKSTRERSILDTPGQSGRELNPYWKNGGSGLPEAESVKASLEPPMDAGWWKKSLRRAKEQAAAEGRSLEDVAEERWGSLETILSMIAKAEKASGKDGYSVRRENDGGASRYRRSRSRDRDNNRTNKYSDSRRDRRRSRSRSTSGSRDRQQQYFRDDKFLKSRQRKQMYKKPTEDDGHGSTQTSENHGRKKWQKDTEESREKFEPRRKAESYEDAIKNETNPDEVEVFTEKELNKIGARIVKAEIMGDTELAAELKTQLEMARERLKSSGASNSNKETVILSRTDYKGITRPLEQRNQTGESNSRKRNVATHSSGERVRHFYDDDKYSLDQLFQREKGRSTNEDDAAFAKVVSKNMDMSEMFEEHISRTQSEAKRDERDRANAINEHKRLTRSLDNCEWCVESNKMLKHMIVSMDTKICLSLPTHVSLTEGHCILTPVQHIACQLQLDEDVWESLKAFKKAIHEMFAARDEYPLFFEVYRNRHKFPHMKLECVPLPRSIDEFAPMYFKKALLECESEWSVNRKVIDLKHKDLRHSIPNGLAYFAVQFADGTGFAHIIEDEQTFPRNFAEEIIGGVLELDHDVWRKPRREKFDQQLEKVLKFSEAWKKVKPDACDK